mmetsp:Transcript_73405/g.238762  ORF Transcript_73405/g.238762 Transcript_73405/m.238762 type:complete len:209 (-) Transcript_73405:140-766(-)
MGAMGARCSCLAGARAPRPEGCHVSEDTFSELAFGQRPALSEHIVLEANSEGHSNPGSSSIASPSHRKPTLLGGRARAEMKSAGGGAPMSKDDPWTWPEWALRGRRSEIEVLVTDEGLGEKRWVEAVPQSRVVDKSGSDTYLSVQYSWDGVVYDEDFGPEQVRRRGSGESVAELLRSGSGPGAEEGGDGVGPAAAGGLTGEAPPSTAK